MAGGGATICCFNAEVCPNGSPEQLSAAVRERQEVVIVDAVGVGSNVFSTKSAHDPDFKSLAINQRAKRIRAHFDGRDHFPARPPRAKFTQMRYALASTISR